MDFSSFIIQCLNGINLILILVLVAIGLVIIFGLMEVINIAHGEFFLLGAYTVLMVQRIGLNFWICLILAPLVLGIVGLLTEFLCIRYLYQRPLDTILATWGISIGIKQLIIIIFGPAGHMITHPFPAMVRFMGIEYPAYRLFTMAASIAVIILTLYVFLKTDYGLKARAVIANRDIASALGINTRRMYQATFVFGSALAGLAGAIMSPLMSVDPQMGLGYLIPAFLAIIIGGTGTLYGVLGGASIIGGLDSIFSYLISPVGAQIVIFSIAIILIRLKPLGLFGKQS
jgi:branched-chain amino acid transport system permease protein/urea transport system permease protein